MAVPALKAPGVQSSSSSDLFLFHLEGSDVERALLGLENAISAPALSAWMKEYVVEEYFHDQIKNRFASEGDRASGHWAPLTEATENIRSALGFSPAHPINERTGKLRELVTTASDITITADSVTAQIPGDVSDPVTKHKLEVAQKGSTSNPLPSATATPARPVLAMDTEDVAAVLGALQLAIVANVESAFGAPIAVGNAR